MNNQAYFLGFVKRAMEYGFSEAEAVEIFKQASDANDALQQENQKSYVNAGGSGVPYKAPPPDGVPAVSLSSLDSRNKKPVVSPIKRKM